MRLSWKQQANRERIHLNFSPYRSTDLLTAADADARDFTGGRADGPALDSSTRPKALAQQGDLSILGGAHVTHAEGTKVRQIR